MTLTATATALLGLVAWALLLIVLLVNQRGLLVLSGKMAVNAFNPDGSNTPSNFGQRLVRTHANCLENLPVFAVIVLVAAALGRLADIQALAPWVLYARIGQSLAHLSGTGPVNVFVRASFWSVQLALFGWMLVKLLA